MNINLPEDIAAIRSVFDKGIAAANAGDAADLAAFYTEDVVVMNPNQPTHIGKEALLQNLHALFDPFTVKMTAQIEEVEVSGDWGFTRSSFTWTLTPKAGGEPNEDSGNWLVIWRRGPDGSWKVAREIWNSTQPPPGTE